VCYLRVEEGGMGMINLYSLIKAKQFKSMHKILNAKNDNWNSIGKWYVFDSAKFGKKIGLPLKTIFELPYKS
jgi:phosphate-selective porin